jgi:hypothetical protein
MIFWRLEPSSLANATPATWERTIFMGVFAAPVASRPACLDRNLHGSRSGTNTVRQKTRTRGNSLGPLIPAWPPSSAFSRTARAGIVARDQFAQDPLVDLQGILQSVDIG